MSNLFSKKRNIVIAIVSLFVIFLIVSSIRKCSVDLPERKNEKKEEEIISGNKTIDSSIDSIVERRKESEHSYHNQISNNKKSTNEKIIYYRDAPFDSVLVNIARIVSKDSI